MWSARPSMNFRLDEPPYVQFWLWKLEAVFKEKETNDCKAHSETN